MLKVCFIVSLAAITSATVKLQERYSWNVLDWNYPDEYSRQQALLSRALVPENALPVGVERWRNKLFVTVPRWRQGIPATLNYIPLDASYDPSPKLTPYPSWSGNELGNCNNGLNTVYRIKADKCDRLWVLDTGTYGYDNTTTNPCPYALNVYDLKTDRRIRRYVLRAEDIVASTFIANIAVDIGKDCDDAFAYFSDELGYGLIAYSWEQNKSWRFSHSYFMPDPLRGDFNIAGLNFQWSSEGIFGIDVTPMGKDGYRTLHFSPIASHNEFSISTKILRDETRVSNSYHDFKVIGARGNDGHLTAKCFTESGVQLFNLIDQNAIGCWNSALSYKPQNLGVIDKDDVGLVFPSDVKVDADDNVWVLSDRMSVFLEAELDYSDINFRIYTAPLDVMIQGTVCDVEESRNYQKYIPNQKAIASLPTYNPNSAHFNGPYYIPTSVPQLNSYSQNTIPKVTSYLNIPKLPSLPYLVSQPSRTRTHNSRNEPSQSNRGNNVWWTNERNYEVYE